MKKIILFDLDGTLIDSTAAIYESFCAAFNAFNLPRPSFEAVSALIGHTLEDMFSALGVSRGSVPEIVNKYRIYYRALMEKGTKLLPGAHEGVALGAEFATLGVVTTKRGDYSKILLDSLGVGQHFSVVIGRESVENPKPHPEPVLKALESLGYNPTTDAAFMIGDTMIDIEAALAAKIKPIALKCGFGLNLESYAIPIFPTALEAVAWVKNQH